MVFNQGKYNELMKFVKQYNLLHPEDVGKPIYKNIMLKKLADLGMTEEDLEQEQRKRYVDPKIIKRIMTDPKISEYDKRIYQNDLNGVVPRGCYSHQYKYIPPKGTEGYKRFENSIYCGNHCICVDKGVDKKSIDKINKNKSVEIAWACDGEHHRRDPENIEYGISKPPLKSSTIIEYKGKNKKRLKNVLSSICTFSNVLEQKSGLDVCSNPIPKKANTFSISSKKRNTKEWWEKTSESLDNLLDMENKPKNRLYPKHSLKKNPKKSEFNLGFEY